MKDATEGQGQKKQAIKRKRGGRSSERGGVVIEEKGGEGIGDGCGRWEDIIVKGRQAKVRKTEDVEIGEQSLCGSELKREVSLAVTGVGKEPEQVWNSGMGVRGGRTEEVLDRHLLHQVGMCDHRSKLLKVDLAVPEQQIDPRHRWSATDEMHARRSGDSPVLVGLHDRLVHNLLQLLVLQVNEEGGKSVTSV